jgi:hypothetical protein
VSQSGAALFRFPRVCRAAALARSSSPVCSVTSPPSTEAVVRIDREMVNEAIARIPGTHRKVVSDHDRGVHVLADVAVTLAVPYSLQASGGAAGRNDRSNTRPTSWRTR